MSRAFSYYRPKHVERSVLMTWKAAGLNPQGRSAKVASKAAYWLLKHRTRRHNGAEGTREAA